MSQDPISDLNFLYSFTELKKTEDFNNKKLKKRIRFRGDE